MEITIRPMTLDEAWQHISNCYVMYHRDLKKYGYSCWPFISKPMFESFNTPNLSEQEIKLCHDKFVGIYNRNVACLNRFDDIFESYIKPKLEDAINKFLVPLLPSWNATMPEKLDILCTFGRGASYNRKDEQHAIIDFRMSRYPDDKNVVLNTLFHEFVHMLIEKPIIQKYKVPQDLKERIVELICYEFIKAPVRSMFADSFANAYITPEIIKTDLPGAVEKMMADYKVANN